MLELHCHTTCSDGSLSPTELVSAAIASGVQALAITDHDTVAGWDEAMEAAASQDLEIVPGLELSTMHNERSLHILGFYPDREKLTPTLKERLEGRKRRAKKIANKLAALGYPIELPVIPDNMAPGRPHLAAALVEAGHAATHDEAFDRWLGDNGPAYVPYEKLSAVEGIQRLRHCGAVPVWAHPYLFRGGTVAEVLPELIAAGLMGIEAYHPTHSPTQQQQLIGLCRQSGLIVTGGSDYHGPAKPGFQKTTLNQLQVPLTHLEKLQDAALQLRGFRALDDDD